jgi:hypothetical protein
MVNCASTSNAEPKAISKKWQKSISESLDDHSAIFEGMETVARSIWSVNA